jgi:hypothetical protein
VSVFMDRQDHDATEQKALRLGSMGMEQGSRRDTLQVFWKAISFSTPVFISRYSASLLLRLGVGLERPRQRAWKTADKIAKNL